MEIVPANPDDAKSLTHIAHAAKRHWGYPESWIEAWREQLTITPEWIVTHETWKAVDAGEIVGFVSWVPLGRRVRLEHLWVRPDAMGRGLGRQLFKHACRGAESAGWLVMEITVDPNAAGFYRRMGAVQVAEERTEDAGVIRVLPIFEYRLIEAADGPPLRSRTAL